MSIMQATTGVRREAGGRSSGAQQRPKADCKE